MITHEIEQRSDDWFELRRGKVTSSKVKVLMAARGLGKTAQDYAIELAGAEHQEFFEESYISSAMQDGIDNEPLAKDAYEVKMMCEVTEVGFVSKDETEGSSPDGLVGNNGQIEIKCPGTANHLRYLMSEDVPSEHYDQVQHQLYVTQRTWCDFVSFNPYFKQDKQLKIIRVEVDPKWVEKYKQRKAEFDKLVNEYKQKLK